MLSVRVPGRIRSGRWRASSFTGNVPEADRSTPGGENGAGPADFNKEAAKINDEESHLFRQRRDGAIAPFASEEDRFFRAHPAKALEERLTQRELKLVAPARIEGARQLQIVVTALIHLRDHFGTARQLLQQRKVEAGCKVLTSGERDTVQRVTTGGSIELELQAGVVKALGFANRCLAGLILQQDALDGEVALQGETDRLVLGKRGSCDRAAGDAEQ